MGDLGIVTTQHYTFPDELALDGGKRLGPIDIAYETYGELNPDKSNAVLILHALSGDAHAAGRHRKTDKKSGWWDVMIGPDKAFDTNKYFVICSNMLGGCKGTTGPSSIDPGTGRPYGLSFPVFTIKDIVEVENLLIEHLGIKRLLSVAGGSMGGMQALQWIVSYPAKIGSAVVIASSLSQSALNIALQEVGRQAILTDDKFNGGDYYGGKGPSRGLSVARMIGHISYLSEQSMHRKFGRSLTNGGYAYDFSTEFEVQSYLNHKGMSFVDRFDANSYLYITKAIDYFHLDRTAAVEAFRRSSAELLAIGFSSDWLYPTDKVKEISGAARAAGRKATYFEVDTDYGHDAFLLEHERQTPIIRSFLKNQEKRYA